MIGVGERLKEARLKKRLSIDEVEEITKIRTRYIQALEQEDFSVLPGKVYIKGFLKTYAKLLELDEQELLNLYDGSSPEEKEVKQRLVKKHTTPPTEGFINKKYRTIFLGIIAILTLFGLQQVYLKYSENNLPSPPVPPIGIEQPAPDVNEGEAALPPEEEEPPANEVVDKLVLTIETFDQSCWVRVYGDGAIVYEKTMQKGEQVVIEANETIQITLGNAGVTRLKLGNEDLGTPGNVGQVVTTTFKIEDYQ